ncbi:MAG TPA: YcgN family cysteine cluster protein [Xanthobacteraceae bacterium]|nr:YcgN family cysteine cluster protein [Xanthobacteraceae bacterium]
MTDRNAPFWQRKRLAEMSDAEWESLCDGCGRCCLVKLEDEDTEDIYFTNVGCRLLDAGTCRCRDYAHRTEKVDDCVRLTPKVVGKIGWLPPTCAYRLLDEGKDLYWWHPLVSGDPDTVHQAGISVRGRVSASEDDVPTEALEDRIVDWPLRWPKRARRAPAAKSERKE